MNLSANARKLRAKVVAQSRQIKRIQADVNSMSRGFSVLKESYKRQSEHYDALKAQNADLEKKLAEATPRRRKMPDERRSVTVKLRINDKGMVLRCRCGCGCILPESPIVTSLHLHVGFYEDGTVGEWFIRLDRESRDAPTASFADEWAKCASFAVQSGGDTKKILDWILDKACYSRDRSGGYPYVWSPETGKYEPHPVIHHVGSVVDYVAQIIQRIRAGKPTWKATPEEQAALDEAKKKAAEQT